MIKAIEGTTLDEIREASEGLMMAQQDINNALLKAIAAASQLD
jgi:hypothetical protein